MTQSSDYKSGYSKGYNTRLRERSEIEQRHSREVLAVAARAERAESQAGVGHCDECAHWTRPAPSYAWGYCEAGKQPGSPFGCWVQAEHQHSHSLIRISTSPKFGCVMFLLRAAMKDKGNDN